MTSRTLAVALLALLSTPVRADSGAPAAVRLAAPSGPGRGRLVAASVLAARRATVATRLAAAVRAVHVEEGDRVAAGALLVTLADDDVRGGLAAAETGLRAAESQERRLRTLLAERAATQGELDQAEAQRAQAQAAVAAARSSLDYTRLRAPFAGTVQARRAQPGDLVGPGQPLVELVGDELELQASLSEAEAAGLAVGQTLRFVAGAGLAGTAEITALTPGGDALSHRRGLKARVRTPREGLRPGAFARLELPAGASGGGGGGVWVPRSAVVERGDLTGVFVASEGRAELRWISPGEAAGGFVAVRAGLRPEEQVIDAPGALRDGQPVRVQP
ncbi:MAG TPA: efflux RND transporter periplasmic adaptor subunit [Anaeromyxobacteraceae bacterium]|nr:efflux RND transporter periplasmic adaptor subunit [Anaeromyxobacteraceae bacterium]